jgi:hypothetical protein
VKPIETRYGGHLFRSRLEARWAAFLDLVGFEWVYEPIDAHWYIPDFALLGDGPVGVEVKPAVSLDELERYALDVEEGLAGHWNHDYLIVGVNPTFGKAIGWHGTYLPGYAEAKDGDVHYVDAPHWIGAPAFWHRCCAHRTFAFHHQDTYLSQPCGCDHADPHCLGKVHAEDLRAMWGRAHEQSRYTR